MQNNTSAVRRPERVSRSGDYFDRVCLLGVKRNSAMLLLPFSVLPSRPWLLLCSRIWKLGMAKIRVYQMAKNVGTNDSIE